MSLEDLLWQKINLREVIVCMEGTAQISRYCGEQWGEKRRRNSTLDCVIYQIDTAS